MKTLLMASAALWSLAATANATPWFTDATANLPASVHGFASIDAVAADLDGDGRSDIYVGQLAANARDRLFLNART